ncbi:MAG: FG-GAP repeat protein [Planctomycetes bacterium]|nr:FG-GAP repeat protein [Planctomycetota bacterium]
MRTASRSFLLAFGCLFAGLTHAQVTTLWQFNGLVAGDYLGYSVDGAGDVNRDGYADLIAGANRADPGGRTNAGQATVFSGKDGSVLYTFNGVAASDGFGDAVGGAGDVNKDGYADVIVGAYNADPGGLVNAGQATVFSGKDGSVLYTFNGLVAGDWFGHSVRGAGDVNNDGYPDLIVGACIASPGGLSSAGQVTVFSGKDGSVLHTFNGLAAGDWLGRSVAGAGDVNRDGYADLICGAHQADPGGRGNAGQATVFSGKDGSVLYTFNGLVAGDTFGYSVAGVGDVDRDGFPDLLVGANAADPGGLANAGQATVFSGKDGSVLHTLNGLAAGDMFGIGVAGAGDVNRDGYADLFGGAHQASPGGRATAGQALVFSGKDGSLLYTFDGQAAGDWFGMSVAGAGDVNRDGVPDLFVGAFNADPGALSSAGQATVFSVAATVLSGSGSPSIGGTIVLSLTAPGDGGLPFQVGSSLGTGPIPIDTRLLYLSLDALLIASVQGVFPGIFSNYSGILDGNGMGTAAIRIPKSPLLPGVRIHSAFVTLKPGAPSSISSISNTFSFSITP